MVSRVWCDLDRFWHVSSFWWLWTLLCILLRLTFQFGWMHHPSQEWSSTKSHLAKNIQSLVSWVHHQVHERRCVSMCVLTAGSQTVDVYFSLAGWYNFGLVEFGAIWIGFGTCFIILMTVNTVMHPLEADLPIWLDTSSITRMIVNKKSSPEKYLSLVS